MHPSNKVTIENVDDVFTYHAPTDAQKEQYAQIRRHAADFVETILECAPDCADRTAAIRKVREAVMTANAAIALDPPDAT